MKTKMKNYAFLGPTLPCSATQEWLQKTACLCYSLNPPAQPCWQTRNLLQSPNKLQSSLPDEPTTNAFLLSILLYDASLDWLSMTTSLKNCITYSDIIWDETQWNLGSLPGERPVETSRAIDTPKRSCAGTLNTLLLARKQSSENCAVPKL